MSSRLVFFQVSPRTHSNKVTFQGTKYRQTGYLKVVLGCIFYFLFFTLLLKRALLVAEIVIIIGGAAFGPPQGRWESEQADEERRTLCLRQRCLDERLIRIWPCYCHHLVAAVHIRPDADSQDAPCFRAYLYINEVYTCSIFFCAAWRRLQTFIHQFIPSFLTLYRVRVTTFWAQMWQITVISVVPQQETQLKPICPYFLDITRKNSAQKCCTLWALYLL